MDHGNQGKDPLGVTILLLVIDGNRGPNGWTTRSGLELGGVPGPAPVVVIEVGGVGMVTRHHPRMTKRIVTSELSVVTWNIGSAHCLITREWIRKVVETSVPLLMFQEVRLPPGSHRTVKWCLSQMCPDYDVWMEEGHETKDPLRDRRDHDFDCGLGLTVITMIHRRVFDASKTRKIE